MVRMLTRRQTSACSPVRWRCFEPSIFLWGIMDGWNSLCCRRKYQSEKLIYNFFTYRCTSSCPDEEQCVRPPPSEPETSTRPGSMCFEAHEVANCTLCLDGARSMGYLGNPWRRWRWLLRLMRIWKWPLHLKRTRKYQLSRLPLQCGSTCPPTSMLSTRTPRPNAPSTRFQISTSTICRRRWICFDFLDETFTCLRRPAQSSGFSSPSPRFWRAPSTLMVTTCAQALDTLGMITGWEQKEAPSAIISLGTGMSLERHLKVVVAGGSLEVCGAASTILSEVCDAVADINTRLEDHSQRAPFSHREGAVCQEDHAVGSVRRHLVHGSVDDGAGAVRP